MWDYRKKTVCTNPVSRPTGINHLVEPVSRPTRIIHLVELCFKAYQCSQAVVVRTRVHPLVTTMSISKAICHYTNISPHEHKHQVQLLPSFQYSSNRESDISRPFNIYFNKCNQKYYYISPNASADKASDKASDKAHSFHLSGRACLRFAYAQMWFQAFADMLTGLLTVSLPRSLPPGRPTGSVRFGSLASTRLIYG